MNRFRHCKFQSITFITKKNISLLLTRFRHYPDPISTSYEMVSQRKANEVKH
jgi:hypothetical protein